MKTTIEKTAVNRTMRVDHPITIIGLPVWLFAAFLITCATPKSRATVFDDTNRVSGLIVKMTTDLFSLPLTDVQRQVLHANNFNQLPLAARPLYLQAVACDVGVIVLHSQPLSATALTQYLTALSGTITGPDVSFMRASVPVTQELLTFKTVVFAAMRGLNVLISGQIAGNAVFQNAMDAGVTDSTFWNGTDWAAGW